MTDPKQTNLMVSKAYSMFGLKKSECDIAGGTQRFLGKATARIGKAKDVDTTNQYLVGLTESFSSVIMDQVQRAREDGYRAGLRDGKGMEMTKTTHVEPPAAIQFVTPDTLDVIGAGKKLVKKATTGKKPVKKAPAEKKVKA